MDFRFSPQEEAFRQEVRAFLKAELPLGWEEQFDPEKDLGHEQWTEFGRQFNKKLAQRRWLALHWPVEYGGLGAGVMQQVIYNEEMGYANAPTGHSMGIAWVGPSLIIYGSEEQKKRFLPAITNDDETWCTLYSEPGSGSDLASLKTCAVRDGDEWVINGQKIWTTWGHLANWGWLAARTNPDVPVHKGISMFLVPMKSPGLTVRPLINMANQHSFNEIFFENVRIPAGNLVGEENRGWYQLAVALDIERSSISGVAKARRWWEDLVQFVRENRHFMEVKPPVRHRLVEIGIEIGVGQNLSYRVASLQQAGKVPNYEASIAKLYTSELSQRLARTGVELMGLYGPLRPKSAHARLRGRFGHYYAASVADTIGGGTSEIMRNVVAQRGLGLPRS